MRDLGSDDLKLESFDLGAFPRTHQVVRDAVRDEAASAVVGGFWSAADPDAIQVVHAGKTRWGAHHAREVTPETVFDLSSVSKVMGTWALFGRLADRGWIGGETWLGDVLPGVLHAGDVRMEHLLSHTSGFEAFGPYWKRLQSRFAPRPLHEVAVRERQQAMREIVQGLKPEVKPGVRRVYSDVGFLFLGWALEEAIGLPLDEAVARWVWEEMGLQGARYVRTTRPPSEAVPTVAATEDCPWRGAVLQGQVHDDNAWAMGGYAGHSGAFARVRDVLHFARGLVVGGFFSAKTVYHASHRVLSPVDCDRTWGWDTPSPTGSQAGSWLSRPDGWTIGHLGFTGTSLWVDLQRGQAVVLLTNRVHPTRENAAIRDLRIAFHDALFEDLKAQV